MHHLIVGQDQDIILTGKISKAEGHAVMVVFAEIGVQLHVFQEIMHPSHVPLKGEAKAVLFRMGCDLGPGSGFLGNDQCAMVAPLHHGVQVLEELNGFQVLVASVLIGNPLAFLASVIQIEHGCNCIHPQSVHMVLLHPVEGVADQEILYFIFAIVKHLGSPVRVLTLAGVGVFEQGLPVKISQTVGILGEMRRNPVQDNANPGAVQIIHKIHEVLW